MKNVSDIIDSVNHAWTEFDHIKLEKAFCTLTMVYECVIESYGSNYYVLPHLGKDAILKNEGVHALRLQARQASDTAIDIVTGYYNESDEESEEEA